MHKLSAGAIVGIVIAVIIGSSFLWCFCFGCWQGCRDAGRGRKRDIEENPGNYDTSTLKKPGSGASKKISTSAKPITTSAPLLVPKPSTTPTPQPPPISRANSTTYRSNPPVTTSTSSTAYRPLLNRRDSIDLPDRPNAWNTYRPPTPPQNNYSTYHLNNGLDRVTSIPELRGLRRLSSPPSLATQAAPLLPPAAVIVDSLPLISPYASNNLGMHDEGPSRKPTPHFSVPITRPQTAVSNHTSNLGERADSIPMTEISRTGTRSFTPKVRALKRIDSGNTPKNSNSRRKSKSKKVVEEPVSPPRQLITNAEGLTAAQLGRNLPRGGFVPKVAATKVVKDETEDEA